MLQGALGDTIVWGFLAALSHCCTSALFVRFVRFQAASYPYPNCSCNLQPLCAALFIAPGAGQLPNVVIRVVHVVARREHVEQMSTI